MKKLPKRYWLTLIWIWPPFLISATIIMCLYLLWGNTLHWFEGLWFELNKNSWPIRTWYKNWLGTTFVWGGFYAPGRVQDILVADTKTERHEHKHIIQGEIATLSGFLMAVSVFIHFRHLGFWERGLIHAFIMWTPSALIYYFAGGITSILRGGEFYRDNHLEQSARSLS